MIVGAALLNGGYFWLRRYYHQGIHSGQRCWDCAHIIEEHHTTDSIPHPADPSDEDRQLIRHAKSDHHGTFLRKAFLIGSNLKSAAKIAHEDLSRPQKK